MHCDSCQGSRACSACIGAGVTRDAGASVFCRRCLGTGKCPSCQSIRLSDLAERRDVAFPPASGWTLDAAARASRHSRGVVRDDIEIHAIRKWVNGDQALCGAGPIARRLSGPFDPAAPGTCRDCGFHLRP